jgi:cytochrome c biogenesis protein CcmG/thiol:disulfide interchange protein DsbE
MAHNNKRKEITMKHKRFLPLILSLAFILSLTLLVSCQKNVTKEEAKTDNSKQVTESTPKEPTAKEVVTQETESEEPVEEAVEKITYTNLVDGSDFSFEDMKDHVLIVDFWAPWCPPCKAEIPGFIELQKTYKDKKFAVIGVSISTTEDDVKAFIKQQKVNYPVIMGTDDLRVEYETKMGKPITAIPTTFVIDRKGEVSAIHIGAVDKSVFEKEITKLF